MEKINNNTNFFKEAFDDFERQPSDRVWNNIEKGINPPALQKTTFSKSSRFIISGSIFVATLSIILFFVLQTQKSTDLTSNNPLPANEIQPVNETIPVNNNTQSEKPLESVVTKDNTTESIDNNTNKLDINSMKEKSFSTIPVTASENKQIVRDEKNTNTTTTQNNINKSNTTIYNNTPLPQPNNNASINKPNLPAISFTPDQNICKGDKIKLSVIGGTSYLWSTGERAQDIYVNPSISTDYSVIATDENGLQKTGLISVNVANCQTIFVPNAFTPNGDGYQDEFKAVGNFAKNFEIIIVSRTGQLVFSSKNIDDGWDGNYKGSPVQLGTYIYSIKYIDELNKPHTINGHVSVIR